MNVGIADFNQLPKKLKPLILQDAFVEISRFRTMDDFRICPIIEGDNLNHLKSLKWPRKLILYYKCINKQTGKFDPTLFSWDKKDKAKVGKLMKQTDKDKQFIKEYDANLNDKTYPLDNLYNLTVAKLKIVVKKYDLRCKIMKKEPLTNCIKKFVEEHRNSKDKDISHSTASRQINTSSSSRSKVQQNQLSEQKTNDSVHSMSLHQWNHILEDDLNQFLISENLHEVSSILNYLNQEIITEGRNFIAFAVINTHMLYIRAFQISQALLNTLTPDFHSIRCCRGNDWGSGQLIGALIVLLFQKYNALRNECAFYQKYVRNK